MENRSAPSDRPSTTAIYAALAGDVLVAIIKGAAALLTGSAAMTSEAIHTVVDSLNEILLLYGIHRSSRQADEDHPLGYGRELYFWSFIVALLVFALGAGISMFEGVQHILKPTPIKTPEVSYAVLALSFLFEGGALLVSVRQFRRAKGQHRLFEAMKLSKDPPSFMVLFEDSAALLGILIAAAGIYAADTLKQPAFDGAASIAIGLILAATSAFLAKESKSLLIGEQTYPLVRKSILEIANAEPTILKANGLITVQLAPSQITVMLSIEFADAMTAPEIETEVVALEQKVRATHPQIVALFVKPQTKQGFETSKRERLDFRPMT
jgi:cation diffusion facilitator family transporter